MNWFSTPAVRKPTIEERLSTARALHRSGILQVEAALSALDVAADSHAGVVSEAAEKIAHLAGIQAEAQTAKVEANNLASNIREVHRD